MKGLKYFPSRAGLRKAYDLLQHQRTEITENQISLFSQWARIDPRLAEIWVRFLSENWEKINAHGLNSLLKTEPWPNSAGVMLEFVGKVVHPSKKKMFSLWTKMALCEVSKNSSWSQFFWGQRAFGGEAMKDDARLSSEEYKKWGYLGRENLISKNKIPLQYSSEIRAEILKDFGHKKMNFTVRGYWNAIGRTVSLRQAQRDLMSSTQLRRYGKTKGRRFRL